MCLSLGSTSLLCEQLSPFRSHKVQTSGSSVGDFNSKPHLVADPGFSGIAVIGECFLLSSLLDSLATPDADPYVPGEVGPDGNGVNWWQNQNVFRSDIIE
jgi:hypothetical protein